MCNVYFIQLRWSSTFPEWSEPFFFFWARALHATTERFWVHPNGRSVRPNERSVAGDSRLIFFHKLYHNPNTFTASRIKPAQHISMRIDHPNKVQPEFSRTDLLRLSFLPSTISDWNALPRDIAVITNNEKFAEELVKLYM